MNKTDRRHELQQNDLAAYLEQANKRIEPYSKQILVAILLVLAVLVAYSFYNSELEADSSMATMELIQNTNVPSQDSVVLDEINERYMETSAGKLAKLYEGIALISDGSRNIYDMDKREDAKTNLTDALAILETVAQNTTDTLIKSRAYLGIALANNILGNNADAIKAYEQVIAANESEAMVENATSRIESLGSPSSEEFAAWFQTADFTLTPEPNLDPSLPPVSGIPGMPGLDLNLPGLTTPTPGTSADGEANPLEGEAAPRDLDGGLDLPADAEKAAPADAEKAAPAEAEKAAPAEAEKAAPADAEKAAPAEAEKAAPAEAEKAAPAEAEKAAPAEAEKAAPAEAEKAGEGSAADNSATDK